MPPENSQIPPEQKSKNQPVGPMVGIVIIVLLLVIGALYFLFDTIKNRNANPPIYIPGDVNLPTTPSTTTGQ
jgi:hypothetical protein